jgi:hypothetical protein
VNKKNREWKEAQGERERERQARLQRSKGLKGGKITGEVRECARREQRGREAVTGQCDSVWDAELNLGVTLHLLLVISQ